MHPHGEAEFLFTEYHAFARCRLPGGWNVIRGEV
jgi:hypothetical protein